MTERGIPPDISILTLPELIMLFPKDFKLMGQTDPQLLEKDITGLTDKLGEKDKALVARALGFIKPYYKGKERRYSHTESVLHPYRLALSGDTSAGYIIATKLLHDASENFGVTSDQIRKLFSDITDRDEINLIVEGVNAFTRRTKGGVKEDYNAYIGRLRNIAQSDRRLSYLIEAKTSDMIQNALDPGALPILTKRKKPEGMQGRVTKMLTRYLLAGAILLEKGSNQYVKLQAAAEFGKRSLRPNIFIPPKG